MKIVLTGNSFPFGGGVAYGGERMIGYLAEGLINLGHEVFIFAQKGTSPPKGCADFIPVNTIGSLRDPYFPAVKEYTQKKGVSFDVYQCNYFGDRWDKDTINFCPAYIELVWNCWCHIGWQLQERPFNTVSYSKVLQQDFVARGMDTTMIHYGLPKSLYSFEKENDGYAVWIGKIEGGKFPEAAIKLAQAAGFKIIILGPPYNTGTFWKEVAPYIDDKNVFWVRGVDDAQKQKIMSRAAVFISSNNNTWKEHFGIVNIEALAMGVPIIGFNRINQDCAIKVDGIIEDGKHGFLLNYETSDNLQEILDIGVPLLQKIKNINRYDCREQFETFFTAELMSRRYDWFYNYVLEKRKVHTVTIPF